MVLAEVLILRLNRRGDVARRWGFEALMVLSGSLFTALMAQVAIPLPFTPVPITGQTLAVLLVGATLGARRGALSMVVYLAEGLAGLPVFAGGTAGIGRLLGPTGGYLIGFVPAAHIVGWLTERGWDRRPQTAVLMMVMGHGVIYIFGLSWLSQFVGLAHVLPTGLYPFIPGDLLKVFLAAT
ncbi:MAG: biotin transporter BioY, partial [Acidobacteria bacterium]|nr:biotin transporter BioY [Acidobacteriota bacterium]MDW7985528.1 biotin transporter BioY [Acidobacteriota bacterium]